MNASKTLRSFNVSTLLVIGILLVSTFFVFQIAHAQEGLSDPTPTLLEEEVSENGNVEEDHHAGEEGEVADNHHDEGESVENLQRTSQILAELNQIEEGRGPSVSTVSAKAVKDLSVKFGVFGFLLLLLLVQFAFLYKDGGAYSKKLIYILMVLVVVIPTLYFIASTIYVNVISVTKGPVHWHADFRTYACGVELEPPTPEGTLINKTGTPVLHQHVDKRIHVEGVLVNLEDASLKSFYEVQGGEMTERSIRVPTGDGFKTYTNGDSCNGTDRGVWNVFLYKTDVEKAEISKSKLTDFPNYVLSPHIEVPPGDCIIFEFGENIEDTDNICDFTQIDINKGNVTPTWTQ